MAARVERYRLVAVEMEERCVCVCVFVFVCVCVRLFVCDNESVI